MRYMYRINHVETGDAYVTVSLQSAKSLRRSLLRSRGGRVTIVRKPFGAAPDAAWEPLPVSKQKEPKP